MTALKKYARLECAGLWRESPGAQRREVVVSLGEASLVLADGRNETALSHWSLPAVVRLNGHEMPALYSPSPEASGETLELDDATMVEAIETVRGAIAADLPRRGALRIGIFAAIVSAMLGLAVFWLPGAVISHTADVVPMAARNVIGKAARADLERLTGAPCATPLGDRARSRLEARLFGADGTEITIVRDGVADAVELPGRQMLLGLALLERFDSPEAVAAHLLAARLRAENVDPLRPLLGHAGLGATFRLLTTGSLPAEAIAGYGEQVLGSPPPRPDAVALIGRLAAAGVAADPYLRSLPQEEQAAFQDAIADHGATTTAAPLRQILADADWVSLQGICGRRN